MSATPKGRGRVVALGIFDGVHLGHQALLRETRRMAVETHARATAVTFHPHPAVLLAPARAPKLLQTLEARLHTLKNFVLEESCKLAFDRTLAEMSYTTFIDEVLCAQFGVVHVVVGDDFSFGKGRAGNPERFAAAAAQRGFGVTFVPAVTCARGERISSTRIRAAVAAGDVAQAELLLGRPFALERAPCGPGDLPHQRNIIRRSGGLVWPQDGAYEALCAGEPCRIVVTRDEARIDGIGASALARLPLDELALVRRA